MTATSKRCRTMRDKWYNSLLKNTSLNHRKSMERVLLMQTLFLEFKMAVQWLMTSLRASRGRVKTLIRTRLQHYQITACEPKWFKEGTSNNIHFFESSPFFLPPPLRFLRHIDICVKAYELQGCNRLRGKEI